MRIATIHKAKTHLSDLIKRAEAGEDVIICKAGRPIVRLNKYNNLSTRRKSGVWKGKIKIAEDFDQLSITVV
jgi:prevent-host-death family protein